MKLLNGFLVSMLCVTLAAAQQQDQRLIPCYRDSCSGQLYYNPSFFNSNDACLIVKGFKSKRNQQNDYFLVKSVSSNQFGLLLIEKDKVENVIMCQAHCSFCFHLIKPENLFCCSVLKKQFDQHLRTNS